MKIIFLVNDPTEIQPKQTTAMLIASAMKYGFQVGVVGVRDLSCRHDGQPWAQVRFLKPLATTHAQDRREQLVNLVQAIATTHPSPLPLTNTDRLFIRTNPARDTKHATAHDVALALARLCEANGVQVINRPDGLIRAATKLYLLEFPDFTRPRSLVSHNRDEIRSFLYDLKAPAVLKPLQGTRGNDVFFVRSIQDKNLNQIIDVILRQGMVMAQACIPGAELGDTRVVVFKGKALEINGLIAAIERDPAQGDFRSNLHTGGTAHPAVITDEMRKVIDTIGPKLMRDGLALTGLDFIGSQLLEINVFSTGGLWNAEEFSGEDFSDYVIQHL